MDTSSTRRSLNTMTTSAPRADAPLLMDVGNLGAYAIFKRALDIAASTVLLLLSTPFLAVIALVVLRDSKGPVVFRQNRVGKNGSLFVLYKFRTMVVEAPNVTTEEMRTSGKSYYTPSGTFLRRFSLDELPQLWNVLRGDMSIVGPRPSLDSQDWLNTRRQLARVQDLRPGITGWAQVSGRDGLCDGDKVTFDAEYRAKCSFLLDCKIVLLTIKTVFTGDGAN